MRFINLFIITVFLIACNSGVDRSAVKDKSGKSTYDARTLTGVGALTELAADRSEELSKLTPLGIDQVKALAPENLGGLDRSRYNAQSQMGYAMVDAEYKDSATGRQLDLTIIDCAGDAGAGIYSTQYYSLWNFEQDDDNGYQRSTEIDGEKAIERYNKKTGQYQLTYFSNDRLLVTLKSKQLSGDDLLKIAREQDFKL